MIPLSVIVHDLLAKVSALIFNRKLFWPLGGVAHRKCHHRSICLSQFFIGDLLTFFCLSVSVEK
jgi:hypothetical protein